MIYTIQSLKSWSELCREPIGQLKLLWAYFDWKWRGRSNLGLRQWFGPYCAKLEPQKLILRIISCKGWSGWYSAQNPKFREVSAQKIEPQKLILRIISCKGWSGWYSAQNPKFRVVSQRKVWNTCRIWKQWIVYNRHFVCYTLKVRFTQSSNRELSESSVAESTESIHGYYLVSRWIHANCNCFILK